MKFSIALLALLAALLAVPAFAQRPTPYTPSSVTSEQLPPEDPNTVHGVVPVDPVPLEAVVSPVIAEAVETKAEDVVADKTPDIFGGLFRRFGTFALAIWGMTYFVGKGTGWSRERIALVLGPLGGVIAYGTGWIDFHSASVPWGFVGAAFVGAAGTIAAGTGQDYLVKAFTHGAEVSLVR